MADEPTNAESKTPDSPDDDSGAVGTVVQSITLHGDSVVFGTLYGDVHIYLAETVVAASVLTIFCKAFLEALGKRAGDGLVDLVKTRVVRKGIPDEYRIGIDDGSAAKIIVTADTPDEARLALLDLDVTADELRGKLLRWDHAASAWRSTDDK
jgi:hypothetical protein